ncbi:hypothetical protein OTU49_005940 [Cherax quadricarinatus]|uniref:MD-2-related lipid-recognition domain-containing protein n=2 Tax=Cherax quadricarinatus TaxID=27406 RepID=A0AAW0X4T7_CHEQU
MGFMYIFLVACTVTVTWATIYDIPFRSCRGIPGPSAIKVNCSSFERETCTLTKGQTYSIWANFTPQINVNAVQSSVAWKTWVEMPLPGQDADGCNGYLECPLAQNTPTTFTYPLQIQNFWMRRRYPIVWRLKDANTDIKILCFTFKILIT